MTSDLYAPVTRSPAAVAATGVTYRQLDYWARQGWLHPQQPEPGSGYNRSWPDGELRVAAVMATLVAAGLRPSVAARVARSGPGRFELAPGVTIDVPDLRLVPPNLEDEPREEHERQGGGNGE